MTEYEHVTYSTGYSLRVTPEDRGADVLHYLITGGLLGGRSLEDVTWEEIDGPEIIAIQRRRYNDLMRSMKTTKSIKDESTI